MESLQVKTIPSYTHEDLERDAVEHQKLIDQIKEEVSTVWDNINNPVPFHTVQVYEMVSEESA
jgi:hypothetical protein